MTDQETNNIHPEFSRQLNRVDKQSLLGQKGIVVWLVGLSGSGKSTIANALEKRLHQRGNYVTMLDGDNLRSGINSNLGFSDEDRQENIRRASEVAKILLNNGAIVLVSLITPREQFRQSAKQLIGQDDFIECYVRASFETCQQRDVKGLYAKQKAGEIKNFTGASSNFEEPTNPDILIDTELHSIDECVEQLYLAIKDRI